MDAPVAYMISPAVVSKPFGTANEVVAIFVVLSVPVGAVVRLAIPDELIVIATLAASVPPTKKSRRLAAAVPIATVVGNGVALLIGGVVITETVFNIPGIGRLVVDAIARRDYPIIQGVIMVFSGVYVLVNLLVDLSYTLFDPRVRG